jgi:hypothetical protein
MHCAIRDRALAAAVRRVRRRGQSPPGSRDRGRTTRPARPARADRHEQRHAHLRPVRAADRVDQLVQVVRERILRVRSLVQLREHVARDVENLAGTAVKRSCACRSPTRSCVRRDPRAAWYAVVFMSCMLVRVAERDGARCRGTAPSRAGRDRAHGRTNSRSPDRSADARSGRACRPDPRRSTRCAPPHGHSAGIRRPPYIVMRSAVTRQARTSRRARTAVAGQRRRPVRAAAGDRYRTAFLMSHHDTIHLSVHVMRSAAPPATRRPEESEMLTSSATVAVARAQRAERRRQQIRPQLLTT